MQLKLAASIVNTACAWIPPGGAWNCQGPGCGSAASLADLCISEADAISDPSKSQRHLGVTDYSISLTSFPLSQVHYRLIHCDSYSSLLLLPNFYFLYNTALCPHIRRSQFRCCPTDCSVKTLSKAGYFNPITSKFFGLAFSFLTWPHPPLLNVNPQLQVGRVSGSLSEALAPHTSMHSELFLPLLTQSPRPLQWFPFFPRRFLLVFTTDLY